MTLFEMLWCAGLVAICYAAGAFWWSTHHHVIAIICGLYGAAIAYDVGAKAKSGFKWRQP